MANINSLSPFNFGTHPVRVVMRDNEPWFVATDICTALGYKNTSKAIADHLDDDERSNEQLDRTQMGSKAVIINESGLYALVLRSRKPEARKFAKWVTSEVLPSIRKTGSYSANNENPKAKALALQKEQRLAQAKADAERILTNLYGPLIKHLTEYPLSQASTFRLSQMTKYDGYTVEKYIAQV